VQCRRIDADLDQLEIRLCLRARDHGDERNEGRAESLERASHGDMMPPTPTARQQDFCPRA
jgi:hypothetical protein